MCSLQQDGAKERAPCIDYETKTATLSTSFGEITLQVSPEGLLIKGVADDQSLNKCSGEEAQAILSLLTNHALVGDKMTKNVHLYRTKLKLLSRIMDFQKNCVCPDHSVLKDMQSIFVTDTNHLIANISGALYATTDDIRKDNTVFIMKMVRLANR